MAALAHTASIAQESLIDQVIEALEKPNLEKPMDVLNAQVRLLEPFMKSNPDVPERLKNAIATYRTQYEMGTTHEQKEANFKEILDALKAMKKGEQGGRRRRNRRGKKTAKKLYRRRRYTRRR